MTTLAILSTGAFALTSIYSLASAWIALDAEANAASNDEELEAAAEHFGKRMGAQEADLVLFLTTLFGAKAPIPRLPPPDPNVPATELEVIVSDESAVDFFTDLLRKYRIRGTVRVEKP